MRDTMSSTELRCVVEKLGRVVTVELTGMLHVVSVPTARNTVLECLAEEPKLIIMDLAGMRIADELTLSLFRSLARQAAAWPGSRLALAAATPEVRAAMDRMAIPRDVALYPTVELALADADRGPTQLRVSRRLAPTLQAASLARALVREACRAWRIDHLTSVAELVITELTANGVRHAGTDMEVIVTLRQRHLHLAVRDGSPSPPHPGRGGGDSLRESGRGLLVVESVAAAWGWTPTSDGKVVSATLRTVR